MSLKTKLKNRELTIGTWLMLGNASVIEILAYAGFEWLVIDLEHTDIGISQVKQLVTTIQALSMYALVRVSKNEEVIIKRVLDIGADGVIVPMICDKEEAQRAVNYCKYPPQGKRGVGLFRAQGYGMKFLEYQAWCKEEQVIIVQIEHIDGVKNIRDILSVDGIDGAIIGPYDMSASMGFPGEFYREDVQVAVNEVIKSCQELGKSVGFHEVATDHTKALTRIKDGCNLIAFGIDYFFMRDKAIQCMSDLKSEIDK